MEQFEQYEKGGLLKNRYSKVSDISEGSYGLVSVAKDTKRDNLLVAVKYIYPIDYKKNQKKDHTKTGKSITGATTERPNSSPARLKSPAQIAQFSKQKESPIDELVEDPSAIFDSLKDEAQKEIKIHEILGDHPNISKLYDNFDSCLVLEFCSRGDLYEAIHKGNGPATTSDIKDVFHQIVNAVDFCHSKGVYHRDLKPENILIAEDWSVKLCDWGLATTTKVITDRKEFNVGSERYMAPELFDPEIESYDASKVDIWSLGVILLTLVFHKNPFQIANYSDKRFLQFVNNREALFDFFSTMSGDLFSVLRFSLTMDPGNRDLNSLDEELSNLRFFTIDEEYEASDYEYEYDEEEEEEEEEEGEEGEEEEEQQHEVEVDAAKKEEYEEVDIRREEIGEEYGADELMVMDSFDEPKAHVNSQPQPQQLRFLDERNAKDEQNSPLSLKAETRAGREIDAATDADGEGGEDAIPHNHRADALLSLSTRSKPIPIRNQHFKFIRNTRKPLNVASYNQNQNSNVNGRYSNSYGSTKPSFHREDYFTPKSVFNHYMDKYGDNNRGRLGRGNNAEFPKRPPPLRRKRTWKQNFRNKKSTKTGNGAQQTGTEFHGTAFDYRGNNDGHCHVLSDSHNHYTANRRKSRSYSTSKLRRGLVSNGFSNTGSSFNGGYSGLHPAAASSVMATSGTNGSVIGTSVNSNLSNSGKYIPPYLRSPNNVVTSRSPISASLSSGLEHLTLENNISNNININNIASSNSRDHRATGSISNVISKNINNTGYDEVFHLEDDFDETFDQDVVSGETLISSSGELDASSKFTESRGDLFSTSNMEANKSSSSSPNHTSGKDTDHSDSGFGGGPGGGKYIPPFRRASVSQASSKPANSNGGSSNASSSNTFYSTTNATVNSPSHYVGAPKALNSVLSKERNKNVGSVSITSANAIGSASVSPRNSIPATASGTATVSGSSLACSSASNGLKKLMTGFSQGPATATKDVPFIGKDIISNGVGMDSNGWFPIERKNWSDYDD